MSFNKCLYTEGGRRRCLGKAVVLCGPLLLALLLPFPSQAAQLRDQTGKLVELPQRAHRIISLAPNITELVFALGAGDSLAGCCQHSNYPPETRSLPRVGSYYRPDLERIVALRPDLCLAVQDGTPVIVLERLEQMGIPVFVLNPQSLESLREALLLLGEALDRREEAELLAVGMDERLAREDATVAEHIRQGKHRPTVLIRVQAKPFMAAARGTYPAELVERSGGRVPLQGDVLYPRMSAEQLLALSPDIIIVPEGGPMQPESPPGALHAVPVHSLPEDLLFRPSLRSLDALNAIIRLLWAQEAPVASFGRGGR